MVSKPLAKHQPCGCVVCTCEEMDLICHGCGAKHCGTHPVGQIPNPAYACRRGTCGEGQCEDVRAYGLSPCGHGVTLPAPTDEEILKVADTVPDLDGGSSSCVSFARALLAAFGVEAPRGPDVEGAVAALENAGLLLEADMPQEAQAHITHAIGLLRGNAGVAEGRKP